MKRHVLILGIGLIVTGLFSGCGSASRVSSVVSAPIIPVPENPGGAGNVGPNSGWNPSGGGGTTNGGSGGGTTSGGTSGGGTTSGGSGGGTTSGGTSGGGTTSGGTSGGGTSGNPPPSGSSYLAKVRVIAYGLNPSTYALLSIRHKWKDSQGVMMQAGAGLSGTADSQGRIIGQLFGYANWFIGQLDYWGLEALLSHPYAKFCSPQNFPHQILTQQVTDINIYCVPLGDIGGNVSGLGAGKSLKLKLTGDRGTTERVTVSQNGVYKFFMPNAAYQYTVQIEQQPLGQTCTAVGATSGNRSSPTLAVMNMSFSCQ